MPSDVVAWCNATLADARLQSEQVTVQRDTADRVGQKYGANLQVVAKSEFQNEFAVGFDKDRPAVLNVVTRLRVQVFPRQEPEVELISYMSTYSVLFDVKSFDGIKPDADVPFSAVTSYLSVANWLAVRRADSTIAQTGVGNLRIKAPVFEEPPKDAPPPPAPASLP